jgi:hypothetical protein
MILMRICKRCHQPKRTTEFYKLRRDGTCKDCWRASGRARYVPRAQREPSSVIAGAKPRVIALLQAWCVRHG